MDNLINSLVGNFVSNAGNANMAKVTDYQGKTYDRDQLLALSKQVAGSIDPNAVKGGVFNTKGESVGFNYDEATKLLGHPPTAAEQVILDMSRHLINEGVTDLNQADASTTNRRFGSTYTGGGGTIYELKKDADGKPIISSWSKDTSDKKAILTGLAVAAAAFGIPGVTEGLLSGAPVGSTLGSVGAEAVSGSTLGSVGALGNTSAMGALGGQSALGTGLTAAGTGAGGLGGAMSALGGEAALGSGLTAAGTGAAGLGGAMGALGGEAALGAGIGAGIGAGAGGLAATNSLLGNAALGSTLAGASTLPIGTTLANLGAAGAGGSLLNAGAGAATSALGTTLGQGLALNALGTGLGAIANQSGISNARDAITQGGETANTALNNAYANAQALNTAGRTDLANNYANLNTNLNNTINAQAGAYNLANQNINRNAQTQLGLLGSTYQGQKDQAAANATALNTNYGNTRGDLYDIYNRQVGIQQPYQDVGRAGSQGLINNQDYLTRQFGAADLNSQLAPNYAFQLAQGQMANQRAANMGGGSLGGNALRGLQDYTQNYAAGAYQNAFNNFNTQRQNIYSTLAGMANIGTTSGGQLASLGNTLGGNLGSLSNTLGSNLTSNTGNLLGAGTAYGTNTSGVTNNLNNVLSSNLGQMQGAYNQYGSNLLGGSTNYANNLTTNTGAGMNAANVYGLNSANLATGIAGALAGNATATGANNATALSNLGNTALLGSMLKAT